MVAKKVLKKKRKTMKKDAAVMGNCEAASTSSRFHAAKFPKTKAQFHAYLENVYTDGRYSGQSIEREIAKEQLENYKKSLSIIKDVANREALDTMKDCAQAIAQVTTNLSHALRLYIERR